VGRVLAVDLGSKRVGLALSDPLQMISQPFKTLAFVSLPALAVEVKNLVHEMDIQRVVVGLPVRENGTEGPGCRTARDFAELLHNEHIQTELWDERYSSRLAENVLRSFGKKRMHNKEKIDRIAASYILEGYLRSRR